MWAYTEAGEQQNLGKVGNAYYMNDVKGDTRWMWGGGTVPDYKDVHNKPESEFLASQATIL